MSTDDDYLPPIIEQAYCVHCKQVSDCYVEFDGCWTAWYCKTCDSLCDEDYYDWEDEDA